MRSSLVLAAIAGVVSATHFIVDVAPGGALVYNPSNITASVGDMVTLAFTHGNFSATQSLVAEPCTAIKAGINTGFVSMPLNFTFAVTSIHPLVFFSDQGNDCEKGMVFSVNAPNPDAIVKAAEATSKSSGASKSKMSGAAQSHSMSSGMPKSTPKKILVQVGPDGAPLYNPPNVNASVGDAITFVFTDGNFTVTQSSVAAPCTAMAGEDGFDTGFVSTPQNFTFDVEDIRPLVFFSKQANDCEEGMVFSVNVANPGAIAEAAEATDATNSRDGGRLVRRTLDSADKRDSAPAARSNGASTLTRNAMGALAATGIFIIPLF